MTVQRDARHVSKPKRAPHAFSSNGEVAWTFKGKPTPIMYEDEGQEETGEANLHTITDTTLFFGIMVHLASRPELQVCSNLNCYYSPKDAKAYVSPDVMVVRPVRRLPEDLSSHRIGTHGPAPTLAAEILSARSFQQRDLTDKPIIYGLLGVDEYILTDASGELLRERLLVHRRQEDGTWIKSQDSDGGVTSALGFRIIVDDDNLFRVVNAKTGEAYLRPDEGQAAEDARRKAESERLKSERERHKAEARIRQLEAEVKRLRKRK